MKFSSVCLHFLKEVDQLSIGEEVVWEVLEERMSELGKQNCQIALKDPCDINGNEF